jgi:mannose-1-phosphate guanylyltransferase
MDPIANTKTTATSSEYHRWALVLAGGNGVRLKDLTTRLFGAPIPKQYCRLVGDRSLLESTLERSIRFAPLERTLVIVNRDHLRFARGQLVDVPSENVIVQPDNLDTGPGLLLSATHVFRRDPTATLAVFPSDHFVRDANAFTSHLVRAARVVERLPHVVALLCVPPREPAVSYGYVRISRDLALPDAAPAFHVDGFVEKPAAAVAARLVAQNALWSSFVMVSRVNWLLSLCEDALPGSVGEMQRAFLDDHTLEQLYRRLLPWNFSRDVLSRVPEHLVAVRADGIGWHDLGTPEAVEEVLSAPSALEVDDDGMAVA